MARTAFEKKLLVPYSAEQMFVLVDEVENYPQFLPWYGKTEVLHRDEHGLEARLHMDYMGVKQSFATRNRNVYGREIKMSLLDGPFKSLEGTWTFQAVGDDACQIALSLRYELEGLLGRVIAPVFGAVSGKLVEAFVREAGRRYA